MNFSVHRVVGCYNFCKPKEEAAQYIFDIPGGHPKDANRASVVMPLYGKHDIGDDCPFEALKSCTEYAKSCLYNSDVSWLVPVLAFVEANRLLIEKSVTINKIQRLTQRRDAITKEIASAERDLADIEYCLEEEAIAAKGGK